MTITPNLRDQFLTADWILNDLIAIFPNLNVIEAWGEKSLFYNPDNILKRGVYFCTLKAKDGDHDKASELNRNDVFRVSFGISKKTFLTVFTELPKRPIKSGFTKGPYNFKALDTLIPHPVYAWMAWVAILNPSINSWNRVKALLSESHMLCGQKYNDKLSKQKASIVDIVT